MLRSSLRGFADRYIRGQAETVKRKGHAPRRYRPRVEALEARAMLTYYGFNDIGYSVALADNGDVLVSGGFRGWSDFDPGPGEYWLQGTSFDLGIDEYAWTKSYVARYSPAKELIWAQAIPDSLWADTPTLTYADESGSFGYHAWYDRNSLEFKVSKFSQADGSLLWSKPGRGTTQWAVDTSGALYFAGGFNGANVDFDPSDGPDPTPLTGDTLTSDGDDAYAVKWDANGNFVWVRQIGGPGNQGALQIAIDSTGVYLSGPFAGTLVPPGSSESYTNQGAATNDGYLLRLDADGNYAAGDTGHFVDAQPKSLALGDGAIFVAGGSQANQDVDPGPGNLTVAPTGGDFFVRVASPTSSPVPAAGGWAYAHMWGGAIAFADGALYMTGKFGDFGGTFDFDPDPVDVFNMTISGFTEIYVYKVTAADGDFVWAKQMGASRLEEYGFDIVVSGSAVISTGLVSGYNADFNPDPTQGAYYDAAGDRQVYVSCLDTSGAYQWHFDIGADVRLIDDGPFESPGDADVVADYQETPGGGGGWKNYLRGGYASFENNSQDGRYHSKGNGSGMATWRFSGLVPGQAYQVNVSYRPDSKNATNAPFKVNGSAAVLINQRVAPNSFTTDFFVPNAKWHAIGTYDVDGGGNLVVVLNDQANGNVVADAVLVFPVAAPPMSPSAPAGANLGFGAAADIGSSLGDNVTADDSSPQSQVPGASDSTNSARDRALQELVQSRGVADLQADADPFLPEERPDSTEAASALDNWFESLDATG